MFTMPLTSEDALQEFLSRRENLNSIEISNYNCISSAFMMNSNPRPSNDYPILKAMLSTPKYVKNLVNYIFEVNLS